MTPVQPWIDRPAAAGSVWLASRIWAAVFLAWVTLGASVAAATAVEAGPGACSSGWDQLLPASDRAQAQLARGCSASASPPVALADQLAIYDRPLTHGPLGPLAQPGTRGAGGATGPRTARTAERLRANESARLGARVGASRPAAFAPLIDRAARTHDIDPLLLHAIARVESRHQADAISHAGAHGLMQVIVPTARRFGVDAARSLHDPQTNLDVSARYLKVLQRRFGNDLPLVLAAYNAGEGAVEKHGRQSPPYRETQGYVRKVIAEYDLLRRVSSARPAPALMRVAAESNL